MNAGVKKSPLKFSPRRNEGEKTIQETLLYTG
jgi:hypothetical protein